MLQTEFEFALPRGYIDLHGTLHRRGTMRLATALDEIEPLRDPRVRANEAYLTVLLLSRVVTRLGEIQQISPTIIEGLFSSDMAYLQELYLRVNEIGAHLVETECPGCGLHLTLDLREVSHDE